MKGIRHEEYGGFGKGLPLVLNSGIKRTALNYSRESNWHEDLELELCDVGQGTVLQNGQSFEFKKDSIALINSDVIHYTGTEDYLEYTCLIISADFCRRVGIDLRKIKYEPLIKSDTVKALIKQLEKVYYGDNSALKTANIYKILLEILIELTQNYSAHSDLSETQNKHYEDVKGAIKYIRENFNKKITLEDISKMIFVNKYSLCREFKRITGQTVIEYTNNYRTLKAAELIADGANVAEAAGECGFDNLSFFTRTFKRYMGALPSQYKKK